MGVRKKKISEHAEQAALFRWARLAEGKYPKLRLLHAIPNGGARHIVTAVRLKTEGVKRGVPDIFLPVARAHYHGIYIELKSSMGRPSKEQLAWIVALKAEAYCAEICYGWDEARKILEEYLALGRHWRV